MDTLFIIILISIFGLINYFIIANLIDKLIYLLFSKIFKLPGLLQLEKETPNFLFDKNNNQIRKINFYLNVVRPLILTILIFGLGAYLLYWLEISILSTIISLMWYFFLTRKACLSGRFKSVTDPAYWITYIMILVIAILILLIKYKN